ncbi:MAG: oxidoreductase, partial [Tolypothrix sp. Co-bin9]|nr:oxidoreductase [Tolypothrix sp. Co-bin9]
QGIDRGEAVAPSLREGVYSQLLMDLAHQSNTTKSWVGVADLEAFLSHNMNSF